MSDSNGNSDPTDDAWDDVPKSAEDNPNSGEEHRVDTVPPPASGDAYSADTVIRDVPRAALEAIRERKRVEREAERSARKEATDSLPKLSGVGEDEKSSAKTVAAHVLPDSDKPPIKSAAPAPAVVEKAPQAQAPARPAQAKPHVYNGPPPVTSGELLTAVAVAVIAIIAGFYLISSAF